MYQFKTCAFHNNKEFELYTTDYVITYLFYINSSNTEVPHTNSRLLYLCLYQQLQCARQQSDRSVSTTLWPVDGQICF